MKTTHILELTAAPIPLVRIAFIGLGRRGMKALERYQFIEGAEIRALVDLKQENLDRAAALMHQNGLTPDYYSGVEDWKTVCQREDIDLVYLCTEWQFHTSMAVYAMQNGKHVAIEVPASTSVDEAWQLVNTAEQTQRHCFMLENCCYDPFALTTLSLARKGMLGTITHCEGAYIHDLRQMFEKERQEGYQQSLWMEKSCTAHGGNPYPTHGIGPIGLLLNIHRGDRLDYLVSLSTSMLPDGSHLNNTLLKTVQGRSILLQHDVTTPRPYSRLQTVCGTLGFAQKYPQPSIQLTQMEQALTGNELETFITKHEHPVTARWGHESRLRQMPNEMNYVMDCRLIYCLRNGLPLDMDVYDAAEWSCLAELSELSAREGSRPISIPDFTRGNWQLLPEHKFYFAD